MAEQTAISWCDATFNCWRGCTKISEGCRNCYADTLSKRNPGVLGVWGPQGARVVASEAMWQEPVKWNREAVEAQRVADIHWRVSPANNHYSSPPRLKRPRVFCASLADIFEDWSGQMVNTKGLPLWWSNGVIGTRDLPLGSAVEKARWGDGRYVTMDDIRERLFQLIRDTPNLDWLILTKRPERWRKCWPLVGDATTYEKFKNIWLGTTVEDQSAADKRIPDLLESPALVRFLSCEPQIGPIDLGLRRIWCRSHNEFESTVCMDESKPCFRWQANVYDMIDWVIGGGESGHGARPMHPYWARSLRDQCTAVDVAFHFKQWGEYGLIQLGNTRHVSVASGVPMDEPKAMFKVGKKAAGRLLDDRTWDEFPTVRGG